MTSHGRPGVVVSRAYRAANRGRYGDANRHVLPALVRQLAKYAKSIRASNRLLSAHARKLGTGAERKRLEALLSQLRRFEDRHFCWKATTHGRTMESLTVIRETVRGDSAIVTLDVTFADGRSCREKERLVRTPGGWRIGTIDALQNKRMQLTRSAMTNGRRGPRS